MKRNKFWWKFIYHLFMIALSWRVFWKNGTLSDDGKLANSDLYLTMARSFTSFQYLFFNNTTIEFSDFSFISRNGYKVWWLISEVKNIWGLVVQSRISNRTVKVEFGWFLSSVEVPEGIIEREGTREAPLLFFSFPWCIVRLIFPSPQTSPAR